MEHQDISHLAQFFKGLADENRLRIISFISHKSYGVGELAETLGLTEPTISHHLSKLRELGLVNLRADGNRRYYRLNDYTLKRYLEQAAQIGTASQKNGKLTEMDWAWIEQLPLDETDQKILRDYTIGGRLKQIPSKQKKLLAILRWLSTLFEPDRTYTEPEVNTIITEVHDDYASLRRDLIEFGFLRRERGGGKYWVTPEDE